MQTVPLLSFVTVSSQWSTFGVWRNKYGFNKARMSGLCFEFVVKLAVIEHSK